MHSQEPASEPMMQVEVVRCHDRRQEKEKTH
jgi:hypothetical protein